MDFFIHKILDNRSFKRLKYDIKKNSFSGDKKMNYLEKLNLVNTYRNEGKYAERIASQITYLDGISKIKNGIYNSKIEEALDYLIAANKKDGVITSSTVAETENLLMELAPVAKSYKQIFISHAHIDMNWMWGYNETVALTIDTFRTILDLMAEYPEFTYGQSQASTYEIIEKYAPEMIDEIKKYIKEGRWEVTACEWVEPDKNMPDGESLTRQILQTKKYLSKLLDVSPDSLDLDFVPDTFGHNLNVPEILSNAGIKYMYHCRGFEGDTNIYRYQSPSGKSTLNVREYGWYNGYIKPNNFEAVPDFCGKNNVDTFLCVFGVGDHGGGPSRRDIERIMEYRNWPFTPDMKFGTMREYFKILENSGVDFPVRNEEINFLLTGCYTTQCRIKMANRIAEARINEVEELSAAASLLTDAKREPDRLDRAWRNILFNHFHDIIPGSGTIETREYALGLFQDCLASVTSYANQSMRTIAKNIDTTSIPFEAPNDVHSEGSGVGFFQDQTNSFRMPAVERGRGPVRALHIFNTTAYDRDEFTEVTLWEYNYDHTNISITDVDGNELDFTILNQGEAYWNHKYTKLLVRVRVAAFGYTTIIIKQDVKNLFIDYDFYTPLQFNNMQPLDDGYINDAPFTLENEFIKAVFDKNTYHIISLTDKQSGKELISEPSGYFRYIDENPHYGMSSWRVGPYMKITDLNKECDVRFIENKNDANYSYVVYEMKFSVSTLKVKISLKKNSRVLEYAVEADWSEVPEKEIKVPQLNFALPVSYKTENPVYDIPYGEIERKPLAHDVPALSFLSISDSQGDGVGIVTDTKYGYRFYDNCGSVNLIRSAYQPDPYPDRGIHNIRIGIMVGKTDDMKHQADVFNHPLPFTPATYHEGILPLEAKAISVDGDVRVSCVKNSENGNGTALRIYDANGKTQTAVIKLAKKAEKAYITDSNESKILAEATITDGSVKVTVPPYSVITVVIE